MPTHMFLVFTNPRSGREEEYNEWYNQRHLEDVVNIPGITGARRYVLSSTQRSEIEQSWKYVAIYEIETDDLQSIISELQRRAGTSDLMLSDALDPNVNARFYDHIASYPRDKC